MAQNANTKAARGKPQPVHSSMRFLKQDRDAAHKIIEAGWATNFTGAIRFALKFASEQVSK